MCMAADPLGIGNARLKPLFQGSCALCVGPIEIYIFEADVCERAGCTLKRIEESDLVFFACSASPPYSQSIPN